MTTTITITGTGSPAPSPTRAGPGVLVEVDGAAMQFDAGRSTLQRLAAAEVAPADLDAVFVTHHHSDHLVGLPDIVMTRWITGSLTQVGALPIVAPSGPAVTFLERMLDPWEDDLAVRAAHSELATRPSFAVVEFDPSTPRVVWEAPGVTVRAAHVRHEPVLPAVGYRVETADGVVAISGDTLACDEVASLAEGADVLVYEAMLFEVIEQWPDSTHFVMDYHADTRLIGRQAAELGVATLVLTHLIPEPTTPALAEQYVRNVRDGGFVGELIVANDLDAVTLG